MRLFCDEANAARCGGEIGVVLRGGIDMTIDPEELETILEDLDFMVEIVRQSCGIVSFLRVAHSARTIRQILKSVELQKARAKRKKEKKNERGGINA